MPVFTLIQLYCAPLGSLYIMTPFCDGGPESNYARANNEPSCNNLCALSNQSIAIGDHVRFTADTQCDSCRLIM